MTVLADIIKRGGKRPSESFDRGKLHASIATSCLSAGSPESVADHTANLVCDAVADWLKSRAEVTSHDIRKAAAKQLRKYNPEAAYLYEQHKITL